MGSLAVKGRIIDHPMIDIIRRLKLLSGGKYLRDIQDKGDYIRITCPYHAEGNENHPSCSVYARQDNQDIMYGTVHCFTCGTSTTLTNLVSKVLEISYKDAEDWLVDNFGDLFIEKKIELPELELTRKKKRYLDESVLNKFNHKHDYMYKRKLTDEVIDKFKIGFNSLSNSITFPVWDDKGNLEFITERSVLNKRFYIPEGVDKPVYLLNFLKKEHITKAYVCESQINALTLQSWGYPAIALFGTGTEKQYDILSKSGIRSFVLCFDGDQAGKKGDYRFRNYFKNRSVFISSIIVPDGKDINDLTKEEFEMLNIID